MILSFIINLILDNILIKSQSKNIYIIRIRFISEINSHGQVHLHNTCPINFIEKRYLDKPNDKSIIKIYHPVYLEYLVY